PCARYAAMLWHLENLEANQRRIVHTASGRCVQIGSAVNGDEPTLQDCSSSSKQKFIVANQHLRPVGHTSFCFNVSGGLPVANAKIELSNTCGGESTTWYGSSRIQTMGQCMDMFGGVA